MSSSETDLTQGETWDRNAGLFPAWHVARASVHGSFQPVLSSRCPGAARCKCPRQRAGKCANKDHRERKQPHVSCASVMEILKSNIYTQVKSGGGVKYFHIYLDHVSLMF